jgi:hypothetical protein
MEYTDAKELFALALAHAPRDFGSKSTLIDLHYSKLHFYAIGVNYSTDSWIALRMYYRPLSREERDIDPQPMTTTDINMLLEAGISLFKIRYDKKLALLTDRDIPPFMINQNGFSRLLRKALESFRNSEEIKITLTVGIGESMILNGRRCQPVRLTIDSDHRMEDNDRAVFALSESLGIIPAAEKGRLSFDIPLLR